MWFKRKPKNRRLGREQVLDVKLRSSHVRAARTRMGAIGLGVVFTSVFGLYLLYRTGEWVLSRCVYENKAFAIQEVDVQTDGIISVDQLRRWAGVKPDENLLALDLARVKRDLEMVPLIQSVSVERILPCTLHIRITEREPVAQVNVPRPRRSGGIEFAVYHLDADGYVMLPLDPRQRATPLNQPIDSLPVIVGINPSELQPGRRIVAPPVQAALQLIMAFDQSPMAGLADLRSVDVSSPAVLIVTTEQGSEVTFGLADLEQQLRRWHSIFDLGQRMSKAIATLDLAVTNNVPARWIDSSAVPPVAPKPPKTFRSGKKHV
ncbi:MAG: cell division protein FtsQ/DivIB [Limisphaerales bacterium]